MEKTSVTKSTTSFYVPLQLKDFNQFCKRMKEELRCEEIEKNREPQYLLSYITNIYHDNSLYRAFRVKDEYIPKMNMYRDKLGLCVSPVLQSIKIHCFALGIAFSEFTIAFDGLTLEEIENFSYVFKKASKSDERHGYVSMCDIIEDLFLKEKNAQFFFSGTSFKRECRMFHRLFVAEPMEKDSVEPHLRRLARGYKTSFVMPSTDGDYDMVYIPYDYDCWAGSQEGIVNLFSHAGNAETDYYIDHFKREQLNDNYGFLYLLLLNQRFTAIQLISEITRYDTYKRKQKEQLNEKIAKLKTVFAFNIISDDQLYQNVYKRMYDLMDIDRLLEDIRDNEQQAEMIRNFESLENEKKTNAFLFGLSILSLFSVLTDAASYFDRISSLNNISTMLSLLCVIAIVVFYLFWRICYRKK